VVRPPPPGLRSRLAELFGDAVEALRLVEQDSMFRYRSADERVEFFRTWYGPTGKAFAALDAVGAQALADDLAALAWRYDRLGGPDAAAMPGRYVEVVATRR
jgi:hypothetical protein